MSVELCCPQCLLRFPLPAHAPVSEILDLLNAEGPWFALGDGETLEDRIHTVMAEQGAVCCPSCDTEATMTEEGLGHLSRELLGQW